MNKQAIKFLESREILRAHARRYVNSTREKGDRTFFYERCANGAGKRDNTRPSNAFCRPGKYIKIARSES